MAQKMKRLLPSLREKKRYLTFKIISESKFKVITALKEIKSEIISYFGQKGMADANIQILKETYDENKQAGVIKVGNKYVNQLKSALMFITNIEEKPVIIKSVITSGILNKAKNRITEL